MPKIRMLGDRMSPYRMGQVIEVSEIRAGRWVQNGYAELVEAVAQGQPEAPPVPAGEKTTPKEEKKEKPSKK